MNSKNSMVKYAKIIKLLTIWPTDWIVVLRTSESTRIIMDSVAIAIVADSVVVGIVADSVVVAIVADSVVVAIVADSVVVAIIAIVVWRTGTPSFTLNHFSCTFGLTSVAICHAYTTPKAQFLINTEK